MPSIFDLPFPEAEAFFKDKLNIPTNKWDDLLDAEHAKAFMTAGAVKADLLNDFRIAVDKAIDGKMSLPEFQKQFDEIVAKHGWQYKGNRNWRSELIWNQNITTAYQAGRWQQFEDSDAEYLIYKHQDGQLYPRKTHAAWNNIVLPKNDPWWDTHFVPNGFGCKCRIYRATKAEYENAPNRGAAPAGEADKGFAYNPGKDGLKDAVDVLANKLGKWDALTGATMYEDIKKTARKAIKENYEEWLDSALKGEKRKDYALLGSMDKKEIEFLKGEGKKPSTSAIIINDRLVAGKKATRHQESGNALTEEEWRILPTVIDKPESVLYDTTNGKLLYVYPAIDDPRKIKIVVEQDIYEKKIKQTINYVDTVFKINSQALEDKTKYKKIR